MRQEENMRYAILGLSMLMGSATVATPAMAQVSVSVSIPGVSLGIHQPVYPEFVLVPGTPVYYAPQVPANYFFYDGLYWVFQDDNWYVSSWYNGPWDLVEPDDVPLFVLRVPVQYYVRPPVFFHTWIVTAPPRWHYHWGPRWTRYHHGWDRWDRHAIPAPAPLPVYQRHYHGERYPRRDYQRVIRHEHYHYQPRDQIVRRHEQQRTAPQPQAHERPVQNRPAQYSPDSQRQQAPQRNREEAQRSQGAREEAQRSQRAREEAQRSQRTREEARPSQGAREDLRQSEPRLSLPQQRPQLQAPVQVSPVQQVPVVQAPVNQAPQNRPDIPRPQRAPREREQMQSMQAPVPTPQRAAVMQERQQERQQQQPRQEQAPRPQQAQGQQGRGEAFQSRAGGEQRQGPRPDRGQERGQDRGRDRGQGRG